MECYPALVTLKTTIEFVTNGKKGRVGCRGLGLREVVPNNKEKVGRLFSALKSRGMGYNGLSWRFAWR